MSTFSSSTLVLGTHGTGAPRVHALMLLETMSDVGRMDHRETDDEPHGEDTASVVRHAQDADDVRGREVPQCRLRVRRQSLVDEVGQGRDLHDCMVAPRPALASVFPLCFCMRALALRRPLCRVCHELACFHF